MSKRIPDLGSRYAIKGELGRGGMGQVLTARDLRLGRSVAIKILPEEFTHDPKRVARLQREARALAKLHHPNIAMIYSLEISERGDRLLILEQVEGETLAKRIRRAPIPAREALEICAQIAAALESAHDRGVIHRDLKPGNVMVTPGGVAKVLDFGLAKVTRSGATPGGEEGEDLSITKQGEAVGTPGYMSPEQIRGSSAERRADIFAFGCVLFECLAGERAFPGPKPEQALAAALVAEPPWTSLPSETPDAVRGLIARCLEKDPRNRLGDMADARVAIEVALGRRSGADARGAGQLAPRAIEEPLTSFVGRESELADAARLLGRARLLTLVGPGGSGKTRLAIRLANILLASYPDGVWLVDFSPLSDAARVAQAAAAAVGVRERTGVPALDALGDHLAERRSLLVLDNCEHLLAACAALAATLLAKAPQLRVVATSREPLRVPGEQAYPVPPLRVSTSGAADPDGSRSEAARLFADRAAAVAPGFALEERTAPVVEEICRRLEGIPLALELAAARVRVLSLEQIQAKLGDQLKFLAGGSRSAPLRHQALAATIGWSYDLLTEEEKGLLRALSVFAGGWTLEAATAVCSEGRDEFEILDQLSRLVDKSLVLPHSEEDRFRYRLLETVRQFAHDRLARADEEGPKRAAHLEYFVRLAERAAPELTGPEQGAWLNRLEEEHENFLTALWWSRRVEGGDALAVRLAGSLWRFWFGHGHFELGRSVIGAVLARTGAAARTVARAEALQGEGALAFHQNDFAAGNAAYGESLELCRELGDERGMGFSRGGLGNLAMGQGDYAVARAHYQEALAHFERSGYRRGVGLVLSNLGRLVEFEGDYPAAYSLYERGLVVFREVGDKGSLALRLSSLGELSLRLGYLDKARAHLLECLRAMEELEEPHAGAYALERSAALAERLGDAELAARLCGAADSVRRRISSPASPKEQQEQAEILTRLQGALGGVRFGEAWAAGTALSFDRAAEEALAWLERSDTARSSE